MGARIFTSAGVGMSMERMLLFTCGCEFGCVQPEGWRERVIRGCQSDYQDIGIKCWFHIAVLTVGDIGPRYAVRCDWSICRNADQSAPYLQPPPLGTPIEAFAHVELSSERRHAKQPENMSVLQMDFCRHFGCTIAPNMMKICSQGSIGGPRYWLLLKKGLLSLPR
jgi:hypothetical protein